MKLTLALLRQVNSSSCYDARRGCLVLSNTSAARTYPLGSFCDVPLLNHYDWSLCLRQGLTDVLYLGMRFKLCLCRFRSFDDFGVSDQAVSGLCVSCS